MASSQHKRILLVGASGVVGNALLRQCLADDSVAQVLVWGRRSVAMQHPKLEQRCVDFAALPALPIGTIDQCYIALGSTIKAAGSRAAFVQVDKDYVLAVAERAYDAGCRQLAVVSALEAQAKSPIFYSRVKGEMEAGLQVFAWQQLVIARPSIIDGDRAALGQVHRRGEAWALRIMLGLGRLIPQAFAPITGDTIAHAMRRQIASGANGTQILTSGTMQRMGA